jgi:hypothetical protein
VRVRVTISLGLGILAVSLLAPAHAETPQSSEPQSSEEAPAATREVRIAELPFLITEEPVFEAADPEADPEAVGPETTEDASRPQLTRATINPFSPIIRPAPSEAPEPATPPGTAPDAGAPTLPAQAAPPVPRAVPPEPVMPPTLAAARLPRALPGVTRPALPPPLTRPRPVSALGYLQDQEVVFTAAVLGPVSVGIFRTARGTAVVALGEALPGSDLVLTRLDGGRAEFTLVGGDDSVTLMSGRRP